LSNNFDIPWLEDLEELKKNEEDTRTITTPVTPAEGVKTQLNASAKLAALQQHLANSEVKLVENRLKMLKKEIYDIAEKIFKQYVLEAQFKPRDLAHKLSNLVKKLNTALSYQQDEVNDWKSLYVRALDDLKDVLREDNRGISSYELSISGLVQAFLNVFGVFGYNNKSSSTDNSKSLTTGKLEDILNHDTVANCHTSYDSFSWIVIDLGVCIIPTYY
jgi:hypothetical protein